VQLRPKRGQVSQSWRAVPDIYDFLDFDQMCDLTAFWGEMFKIHAKKQDG
jgi:hypothetical protein